METPTAYALLGIPFHGVTTEEAVEILLESIRTRQRCFLSTPNLNFLVTAQTDSEFRRSVFESDLSVADGMPLIWLARLLAIPLPERVAGSTLFERLRQSSDHASIRVFFFGGLPGVAELASRRINEESRGMISVGFLDPGMGSVESMSAPGIISRINSCNPDFVVVALGAKKGQAWIQRNRGALTAPVLSHLGAVINFVAGTVRRAPVWMQRWGFEWLWRVKEESQLIGRYFNDGLWLLRMSFGVVLPLVVRTARADRVTAATIEIVGGGEVVRLCGHWHDRDLLKFCAATALFHQQDSITLKKLDLSELTFVGPAITANLISIFSLPWQQSPIVVLPAKSSVAYLQLISNQVFR